MIAATSAVWLLVWAAPGPGNPALENGETLLVIGVAGAVDKPDWNDARIGFGIHNLLVEALSDRFTLVEEKAEVRAWKQDLAERAWQLGREHYDFDGDLEALPAVDWIAHAQVTMFARPGENLTVSLYHSRRVRTRITVSVTLIETATGKRLVGRGKGKASSHADSVGFDIREDAVIFKQNTVGIATQRAVLNAVADLKSQLEGS